MSHSETTARAAMRQGLARFAVLPSSLQVNTLRGLPPMLIATILAAMRPDPALITEGDLDLVCGWERQRRATRAIFEDIE